MSPFLAICLVFGYFIFLLLISILSSKKSDANTFFIANKESPWFLVAYGMIGASLSGITFISVPGEVANSQFTYFQLVIGYAIGIAVIALVLLPLYYRLNLYSIYEYLGTRFGFWTYKTGAAFFLLAQSMVAACRLFLMANVLQLAIFDAFHIPFAASAFTILVLIWLYTFRSGIKTIIYTDIFQTTFLLLAVILSIYAITSELDLSLSHIGSTIIHHPSAKMFDWDWQSKRNFFKLILTGMFLTIVTNGLDQSVMQKHLTCRNLKESWKNMFSFSIMLIISNLMFLILGLFLLIYANEKGIVLPEQTDDIYPLLALKYFGGFTGIIFLLGISAAAYSSADSAITALTTSFCIDFLGFRNKDHVHSTSTRHIVHLGVSLFLFLLLLMIHSFNDQSVINDFIMYAGYTYGPLLGLYIFGLFTTYTPKDKWVPFICIVSPILSYIIKLNSTTLFWGYQMKFEVLLLNGASTLLLLFIAKK